MLGVSVDLIKSVETGRAPVSENLASRIEGATGAKVGRVHWKPTGKREVYTWEPFNDGTLAASDQLTEGELEAVWGGLAPSDEEVAAMAKLYAHELTEAESDFCSRNYPFERKRLPKRRKSEDTPGPAFDRQFFDKWIQDLGKSHDKAAKDSLEYAWPIVEALFYAAAKPGKAGLPRRVPALRESLWEWIIEQNQHFKLGVDIAAV